jgi:hypothetical protein
MVPNFTAVQVVGFPSQILFTDTSTSPDGAVTSRRIYMAKMDGSFLVPTNNITSYIAWAIANATITVDALDKDYSLLLTIQWLDVNNVVLYTKIVLAGFTLYNETFDYYLTQMMAANPNLINDNDFWNNKSTLRTDIDAGNQAISLASDQTNAQLCYDLATILRTGSQYYYNANA